MDYKSFSINQDFMVDERHHKELLYLSQKNSRRVGYGPAAADKQDRGNPRMIIQKGRKWNIILNRRSFRFRAMLTRLKQAGI